MNSFYETIKSKIANDGYFVYREEYTNGAIIFSIVRQDDETTKTIYAEIAANIARMIVKDTGTEIKKAPKIVKALNFIPMAVKPGCIRYQTN